MDTKTQRTLAAIQERNCLLDDFKAAVAYLDPLGLHLVSTGRINGRSIVEWAEACYSPDGAPRPVAELSEEEKLALCVVAGCAHVETDPQFGAVLKTTFPVVIAIVDGQYRVFRQAQDPTTTKGDHHETQR